ncbi:FHA domain-containing protein [Desulfosarcina sp. OttesenSCG-928-A07]|nr:FHA domain-containing protein [Desulfosarcina sp. OttesenSCG-928-A07]
MAGTGGTQQETAASLSEPGARPPISKSDPLPLARFVVENADGTTTVHRIHHRRDFPLYIGRHSHCDFKIDSKFISREHLCVTEDRAGNIKVKNLTDKGLSLSKADGKTMEIQQGHSSWLTSGDRLVLSPGAGKHEVSILCEIFHFPSDHTPTVIASAPFMGAPEPPEKKETALHAGKKNMAMSPEKSTETVTPKPKQAVYQDGGRNTLQTVMPEEAVRHEGRNTMETVIATASQPAPLARLGIRYPDGKTATVSVTSLPFEIGRDPETTDCLVVVDNDLHLSRQHLRIDAIRGGSLYIENLAHKKGGTFKEDGNPHSERFSLTPQDGWVYLAGRGSKASAQLRVIA